LFGSPVPTHTNRRVRRRNRDVANRRHALLIEHRLPRRAVVRCFPNASRSRAHVHDVRIALHHCEIINAPAHRRGTNLRNSRFLNLSVGFGWSPGAASAAYRQRAKNRRTSQHRPQSIPRMLHFHPPVYKARHLTPAGPDNASKCFERHTNSLRIQTRGAAASFHSPAILLIPLCLRMQLIACPCLQIRLTTC